MSDHQHDAAAAPGQSAPVTTPPPAPARMSRRRWAIAAVVAALVVAAASVVTVVLVKRNSGPQAAAGELLTDSIAKGAEHHAAVRLPWGGLTISAGEPVDRIDDPILYSEKHHSRFRDIAPPDGGSWITVKIESELSFDNVLYRARKDATIPATTLDVIADGRSFPLARAAGGGRQTTTQQLGAQLAPDLGGYLALPNRPDDLVVRVGFDGVRQDVHVYTGRVSKGRAAALSADPAKRLDVECSHGTVPGYRIGYTIDDSCHLTRLLRLPYVAGLGWAEPGRTWLVTTIRTFPPTDLMHRTPSGARVTYTALENLGWTSSVRYGRLAPVAHAYFNEVNSGFALDPEAPEQFVFDVAADDDGSRAAFTLTTRFQAGLTFAGTIPPPLPGRVTLTATRTLRAGAS